MTLGLGPAFAFDGSTSDPSEKIPKNFTDPAQALRAGLADLKAGDTDAAAAALTYAAEAGKASRNGNSARCMRTVKAFRRMT